MVGEIAAKDMVVALNKVGCKEILGVRTIGEFFGVRLRALGSSTQQGRVSGILGVRLMALGSSTHKVECQEFRVSASGLWGPAHTLRPREATLPAFS